jgi:crotonobetainyl-CoA:carnitine CoA-transferase CaiB-like acyl-CoA transferase
MDGAVKYRVTLYPLNSTAAILESAQLEARGFWVDVDHPELGTTIKYPGAFTWASESPLCISRRAPLIGEHNQEVYQTELGISDGEMKALQESGVI